MTATVTYPRAGQVEPGWEHYIETLPAENSNAIAAGLIGSYVSNEIVVNPTSGGVRPFVGIVEAKAATDDKVRALTHGAFYGYAEGNIGIGDILIAATSTAGHVKAGVKTGTPTDANLIIGDYWGHPGEGSGGSPITAATVGEIIVIYIR